MAISGRHFQFVQGVDKNAPTDCVCSGVPCAAVGGFAALRMRRAPCGLRAPCTGLFNRARALVHHRTTLTCHCEERSDVAISGRHSQPVQGADKNVKTDCVCSGGHCAAVGGFAALRMRRALYGR